MQTFNKAFLKLSLYHNRHGVKAAPNHADQLNTYELHAAVPSATAAHQLGVPTPTPSIFAHLYQSSHCILDENVFSASQNHF